MYQSFNNNINSFNNFAIPDDRSNILAWLSPLDPRLRHQEIQARRVEHVGEWVLRTEEFRSWYVGSEGGGFNNDILFCYGDPGVGKSFISSLVIDSLCDQAGGQNATVACFYFDFAAQKQQSSTSVMGALLKQLVCGLREIPEEITQAYQDRKNAIGGRGPQLSYIVKMMQIASSKKRTFICIDALDECVPGYRMKLLDSLNQILQRSPSTRVFMTGRPYIRPEIRRCLGGRATSVCISPMRDDITSFLYTRLHEDTTPDAMDSSPEEEILRRIPEDISEIFLLVSLKIDAILQETTTHRRRQKLNAATDGLGLGGVYGETLGRIKGQGDEKSRLGMAALMWISHSERPLKAEELCHALAVEVGSPSLNPDNVPSIRTLLACCQGLVVADKETSTVRLIHFTLQEYLRAQPELFGRAHSTVSETCLSYLNSQQVRALPASPYPDPQGVPFLEYSSLYWGIHAKRDLSGYAKSLALGLFDDYKHSNHISTLTFLKAQKGHLYDVGLDKLSLFSGLHCASAFGILELVACLVEVEGCDINQKDCVGNTPLIWAALNGHEEVIEILLGRVDVNPDEPDRYGQTPLRFAARKGHEGVVKLLLGLGDASPDKPGNDGRTPLFGAAEGGHEGVVKILLERDDVNPDKPDKFGLTPLLFAAENGRESVVKMLLGRQGVNPDKPDMYGQTPLWCAAWNGHEGVVKVLLGRDDVIPDKPDKYSRTPLYCAARNGHEEVVKILLEREDVNPDNPNEYGQTPLYCATLNGHEGVVKVLLRREDSSPDKQAKHGQKITPIDC